jgi:hypothetical protein
MVSYRRNFFALSEIPPGVAFAADHDDPDERWNSDYGRCFIIAGAAALGMGGELESAFALEPGDLAPILEAARSFVSIVYDESKAV